MDNSWTKGILEKELCKDPLEQFAKWYEEVKAYGKIEYPDALCISTIGEDGYPDARMVLFKKFDAQGFVFYTNMNSPKSKQLLKNPKTALTFHWQGIRRQVRIVGTAEIVSDREADEYFATRPRLSQLGAWASDQSTVLGSRVTLVKDVGKLFVKYLGKPVPRPPYWSGFRVIPEKYEFWQDQLYRLHDRFLYTKQPDNTWIIHRLYP